MSDDLRHFISKVESFEIDPGDKVLGFADRLARENRWSGAFAQRVIGEYKRFCILALKCGHPVTPSEEVDQAWHLHLTYTRSYWERFCRDTLGSPLHHEPTAGGHSEGAKFQDWYATTLVSYERIFGASPPPDIWPPPRYRFAHADQWKWINVGRYWLIPKRLLGAVSILLVMLLACLAIPGCGFQLAAQPLLLNAQLIGFRPFPFSLGGAGFLLFYGLLSVLGIATVVFLKWQATWDQVNVREQPLPELAADELAVLTGGGMRLAQVSLVRLFSEGRLDVKPAGWFTKSRFLAKEGREPHQSAVDRDLYQAIAEGMPPNRLLSVVKPHFKRIEGDLVELGLRNGVNWHDRTAKIIVGLIIALGVARVVQGWWVGQEVLYLIIMLVCFTVLGVFLVGGQEKITERGRKLYYAQREKHEERLGDTDTSRHQNADVMALSVALLGVTCLSGFGGFTQVAPLMQSLGAGSAGSSSASGCGAGCGAGIGMGGGGGDGGGGCGGGGCGGGCGGCGS